MAKEVIAAGFVVFRRIESIFEFLLVRANYGERHWSFPKGHTDPGEEPLETAYRETWEEVGLDKQHLKVDSNFQKSLSYQANENKKV